MDFVFYLSDDSFMHLEFQTTVKEDDLLRFKLYDTLLYEQKRKPVRTAVIYGAGINSAPIFLDHGSIKYIVEPVFMGNYDGDKTYNELVEKINAGLTLTIQDKLNLIFLPLMRNSVEKSQRAIEAIELAQKVEDKNEQIFLIGCLVGISDKFIDEEYVKKMLEVLRMTRVMQALYKEFKQEGIEEGKKEGMEKGMEKGKMETAQKMLEDKVDINLIVKYTGLMIEEIKELIKNDRD